MNSKGAFARGFTAAGVLACACAVPLLITAVAVEARGGTTPGAVSPAGLQPRDLVILRPNGPLREGTRISIGFVAVRETLHRSWVTRLTVANDDVAVQSDVTTGPATLDLPGPGIYAAKVEVAESLTDAGELPPPPRTVTVALGDLVIEEVP